MSLDMTDTILDGDLGTNNPLTVIRTQRSVSSQGLTVEAAPTRLSNVFGVVMPASGRQLQRLADGDRVSSGIAVYTACPLIASTDSQSPDQVIWESKTYLVNYIDDFRGSGGFTAAVCTQTNMQGAAVSQMVPQ